MHKSCNSVLPAETDNLKTHGKYRHGILQGEVTLH